MAVAFPPPASPHAYQRHRPETTALYEVVRDNLETLYGAIDDGAIAVRIPKHARKELEAYLLCRGFARLKCKDCRETHLVAFSCKGRGFCPSCLGRRMSATAANLTERVLPETGLRQWVLTFPFPWRRRLAQDGVLLGNLTRIFVETVQTFYAGRAAREGALGAKSGAVTAVQRTSSGHGGGYRPWAEFLARTFAVDVLTCPKCHGRMRLLAVIKEPANVARYLASVGEATEVPRRSPGRGPPYWKSRVLRRHVLDDDEGGGRNGSRAGEVA